MVIRILGFYHLIQAFLMSITLYFGGYTVRTDYSGFYSVKSPIYLQLLIGVVLLIISKFTNNNNNNRVLYLPIFISLWFLSNVLRLLQIDFFLINVVWLYLMPSLYYLLKLKNKKVIYCVIISTIISFIVFTLQGARGYAILPLILIYFRPAYKYFKSKSIVKRLTIFIILISSVLSYMTIIDLYRFSNGRDKINFKGLIDVMSGVNKISREEVNYLSSSVVWDRFLNHPMNYLLIDKHKLRGTEYLVEDLFLILSRKESNYKNVKFGHWTSSGFDFTARRTSSVEWSILSDWSSRFGPNIGVFLTIISYLILNLIISFNSKYILFKSLLIYQLFSSFFVFNFFETLHFVIVAFILNYIIKFIYDLKFSINRNISR